MLHILCTIISFCVLHRLKMTIYTYFMLAMSFFRNHRQRDFLLSHYNYWFESSNVFNYVTRSESAHYNSIKRHYILGAICFINGDNHEQMTSRLISDGLGQLHCIQIFLNCQFAISLSVHKITTFTLRTFLLLNSQSCLVWVSHQTWSLPLINVTWHSGTRPYTVTPFIAQTFH